MDTPDNYYAILGVPIDVDNETLKQTYRQLARRFHPDVAGPASALQMKRINRAYAVLSDPEKRLNYDTVIGGSLDLRRSGLGRPQPRPRRAEDIDSEFSGLSIFSSKGPLHPGPMLRTSIGVPSALSSIQSTGDTMIAVGSLDSKGLIWHINRPEANTTFAADPTHTIESLRSLRFSSKGSMLAGWGRLGLHIWDGLDGSLLWSLRLENRAVSAHYSLDVLPEENGKGERIVRMALPQLPEDPLSPRSWGVRGTDVVEHKLGGDPGTLSSPIVCQEDMMEKRQFWAIRQRGLAEDGQSLLSLSCAHIPEEQGELAVARTWDLTSRGRFGSKPRPQISISVLAGLCADCTPPYVTTPDAGTIAFVYDKNKLRVYNMEQGTYTELESGAMGASGRLAISSNGQWIAVAREDSEVNEGVVDLWSVPQMRLVQKFYHPWQISALCFSGEQVVVSLTDGMVQIWS